jgi:Flp pilus assembly protein TadG
LLEFALVIPVFVFVLYGIIAYGMALSAKASLTNAAADGARAAIGATDPVAAATTRANSAMSSYAADAYTVEPVLETPCPGSSNDQCIRVTITFNYKDHPLVPSAPGLGLVLPDQIRASYEVRLS